MAARKPKANATSPSLFTLAEKQLVGLYDAGVLSPAVLQQIVAAYAGSGIDWNAAATLRTVDKHSVQEAVVLIMMPGRALRSAQKDFISIVEHIAGISAPAQDHEEPSESEEDETLLEQLGGGKRRAPAKHQEGQDSPAKKSAGFNPLLGARAVSKR